MTVLSVGSGLQRGAIVHREGTYYVCGWDDDYIWVRVSSSRYLYAEYVYGSNYEVPVCEVPVGEGEEVPRSAVSVGDDRSILVTVEQDGGMVSYRCRDLSADPPFEEVA